jgi:hypothetical protein
MFSSVVTAFSTSHAQRIIEELIAKKKFSLKILVLFVDSALRSISLPGEATNPLLVPNHLMLFVLLFLWLL